MTLAPYEALKVGHFKGLNDHQRALVAIGSYGRGRNAQAASSRMSAFGGKADMPLTPANVRFLGNSEHRAGVAKSPLMTEMQTWTGRESKPRSPSDRGNNKLRTNPTEFFM
jgi:hypothetical protein